MLLWPAHRSSVIRCGVRLAGGLSVLALAMAAGAGRTDASAIRVATVTAQADAFVEEAHQNRNFGGVTYLSARGGSEQEASYVRFTVSGLGRPATNAVLRVYVESGSADGPAVYATRNDWTEHGITWKNRPAPTTAALDDELAVVSGTWAEYDVTPRITGDGTYSFLIAPTSPSRVTMSSREGTHPPELMVIGDSTAPSAPGSLSVGGVSVQTVSLQWAASTDDTGVAGYRIFEGDRSVATTTATAYTVEQLTCGTSYTFGVEGYDAAGNVSSRATVAASTSACPDIQPPSAPAALTATLVGPSSIDLAWEPATDDVGVVGYEIVRNGASIATAGPATTYSDTGLNAGTTYEYVVRARDAAGNVSSASAPAVATTPADTPPPPPPPDPPPSPPPLPPPPPPPPLSGCDKVAARDGSDANPGTETAPFQTAQRLASSLTGGETGCLRAGVYDETSSGYVLNLSSGGYTIRSYPGERAKLVGIIQIKNAASGVTLSRLDIEGTGDTNTIKIYAADVVLEHSDITNGWRGGSCMILGSNSGYGEAVRTIVRGNRFHECGDPATYNKDHAVYGSNLRDAAIVDNVFWNHTAYAVHLYPNANRNLVAHNVIDGGSPSVRGGILIAGNATYASRDNVVEHNVVAHATHWSVSTNWDDAMPGTGNVARFNCTWAARDGEIETSEGLSAFGNLVADPFFVDRAARDYRLLGLSPCLPVVGYDTAALLLADER